MYVGIHVFCVHEGLGEHTVGGRSEDHFRKQFSPSTTQVLGIHLWSSDLVAGTFICRVISPAQYFF